VDCGEETSALENLTRPRIEGLTRVKKQPATGARDALALLATAFGVLVAGAAGVLVTRSPIGLVFGPAAGAFGYSKQFWRAALTRRPRLAAVAPRERPAGEVLIGVAQPFESTLGAGALAIATTIATRQGVIVRAVEAVPFWLALADRRVLVAGDCWVAGHASDHGDPVSRVLGELEANALPLARASKRRMQVARVMIAPGDRVAVLGRLREEQLAGAGGYRDSLVETVRGEPGSIVWIDRLEGGAPASDRVV
jgi:hypothetical protein